MYARTATTICVLWKMLTSGTHHTAAAINEDSLTVVTCERGAGGGDVSALNITIL